MLELLETSAGQGEGRSGPDAKRRGEVSQEGDRRQVRQLPGPRILGRDVLDLDRQPPELALHRDPMPVQRLLRRREDADPRLLRADPRERERGHHVDVRGESTARLGGGALEDQRLLRDGVEVDLLRLDPRRSGEAARWLARLHRDRVDRADARALDAVEAGDRRRRHVDAAALRRSEIDPVLAADQPSAREHDQVLAGRERPGRDLLTQVVLSGRLDDEIAGADELVEREEGDGGPETFQKALGLLAIARSAAGEAEARDALVEGATQLPTDRAEPDDADPHDRAWYHAARHSNDGSAASAAAARAALS